MKTKYCTNCGKQIPKDSTFCPYCGASLTTNDSNVNHKESPTKRSKFNKKTGYTFHAKHLFENLLAIFTIIFDFYQMHAFYNDYQEVAQKSAEISNRINSYGMMHPLLGRIFSPALNAASGASKLTPIAVVHNFFPSIVLLTVWTTFLCYMHHERRNFVVNICLIITAVALAFVTMFMARIRL